MSDPLLKKVKLKSLDEIVARARDIISRHRRRFLQRNSRPCPVNCKSAEFAGRQVIGCSGCGSHNPQQCMKQEKFSPVFTKEELFKQFADQLRDPGVLLRDYRDVVVFLWVLGAFDEEKRVDESIVPLVEKKHVSTGTGSTVLTGSDGGNTTPSEPNYNVASPSDIARSRRNVPHGTPNVPEPNYNRAETTDPAPVRGQRSPSNLQSRARSGR